MKKLFAIALALALLIPSQAFAYTFNGNWYYNSAIGDNNITECWGFGGSDPVSVNRGALRVGMERWSAILGNRNGPITWTSLGYCVPGHFTAEVEVYETHGSPIGISPGSPAWDDV